MQRRKPVRPRLDPINAGVQLISADEAAALLNVGVRKIHRLMAEGKIPSIKLEGHRRIRLSALQSYVDSL